VKRETSGTIQAEAPLGVLEGSASSMPNNPFGAHLLASSPETIDRQLLWAKHLVGPRGYVKNLLNGIDASLLHPRGEWIHFVKQAYAHDLIPVCRLAGHHTGVFWEKPLADAPLDYSSMATAIARLVDGLPTHPNYPLYIEIWNEPHLPVEWSMAPSVEEYAHFLSQVSEKIRSLGKPNVYLLNAGLSPLAQMGEILPSSLKAFDLLSSHPYPHNHPPSMNHHHGTSFDVGEFVIDAYEQELAILSKFGRDGIPVMITETGYNLGNRLFRDYPMIDEQNRARYMVEAYRDYWLKWPEIRAVIPFLLSSAGEWTSFAWVPPDSGSDKDGRPLSPTLQYQYVAALAKPTEDLASVSGRILSSDGEAPISGARVSLKGGLKDFVTGADGFYILGKLPYGQHVLEVTHEDFTSSTETLITEASQQNAHLEIELVPRALIPFSGSIKGTDLKPLSGVSVFMEPGSWQFHTNEQGYFSGILSPGVYEVKVSKHGFSTLNSILILGNSAAKPQILSLILSRIPIPEANNLLLNSNFEETFIAGLGAGWQSRDGGVHAESYFQLSESFISGQFSQGIDLQQGVSLIEQWTPYTIIETGASYRLSAWARLIPKTMSSATDLTRESDFRILAVFMTNESQALGVITTKAVEYRNDGWIRFAGEGVAPSNSQRAMIEVGSVAGSGLLQIDDVFFGKSLD
jgi:hypothetical protein